MYPDASMTGSETKIEPDGAGEWSPLRRRWLKWCAFFGFWCFFGFLSPREFIGRAPKA